jgi:hypothetical protein
MAIVINAIDRKAFSVLTHVSHERRKVIPAIANLNSATSVVFPIFLRDAGRYMMGVFIYYRRSATLGAVAFLRQTLARNRTTDLINHMVRSHITEIKLSWC